MEELTFGLKRGKVKINLEGEDGNTLVYYLCELNGADRDEFMSYVAKKGVMGPDGITRVKSTDGMDLKLLGLALEDQGGKKIDKKFLATKIPCEVIDKLSERAQSLSKLLEAVTEEDEKGND